MGTSVGRIHRIRDDRRPYAPIMPAPPHATEVEASTDPAMLEGYARLLEDSGAFRVLRRLPTRAPVPRLRAPGARLALSVDVETTGPDPNADEVIELAVVPFSYAPSGRVLAVHEPVSQLREPTRPISARVSRETGIDDDAVRGRVVDLAALAPLIADAALVVAHNAAWDRQFLERLVPAFADLPWACSMTQVGWRGVSGQSLAAVAAGAGFFHDQHRAVDDALAAVEILGRPQARSEAPAMAELLRNAFRETCKVWALNSPFEAREVLRRRGYRWSNGDDGRMRCWVVDVDEASLDGELRFLRSEVYGADVDVPVSRVGPYERFSVRG